MFGYITAAPTLLDDETKKKYRACYCGLCEALKRRYGLSGRITLRYDLTFLALILMGVYGTVPKECRGRCVIHPLKKHDYYSDESFDYAADMNIALTYYKCIDDIEDDKSPVGYAGRALYGKKYAELKEKYPRQCTALEENLRLLGEAEKRCELKPDIPAALFGNIMGELFVFREDEHADALRTFGSSLGRFIYIMDACVDLRSDLKKKRYNPVVALPGAHYRQILEMLMGDCTKAFTALGITQDKKLLENILYAGVWVRYDNHFRKKEEADDGQ